MKSTFRIGIIFLVLILIYFGIKLVWKPTETYELNQEQYKLSSKLSELYWEAFQLEFPIDSSSENANIILDFTDNALQQFQLLDAPEIFYSPSPTQNALSLPGNRIVVFQGLVSLCDNDLELLAVIAHELGHTQLDHVSKGLIKRIGISVLIQMLSGGNQTATEAIELLINNKFTRDLEREADQFAIQLLEEQQISASYLSDILQKLESASKTGTFIDDFDLGWLNTHPNTSERIDTILSQSSRQGIAPFSFISESQFNLIN